MRFNSTYGNEGNKPLVSLQQDAMASVSVTSMLNPQNQRPLYTSDQPAHSSHNLTECFNSNQRTTMCINSNDTQARRGILSYAPRHNVSAQRTPPPSTASAQLRFRPDATQREKVPDPLQTTNSPEQFGANVRYVFYRPTQSPLSDECLPSQTKPIVGTPNYSLSKNLSSSSCVYYPKNNAEESFLPPKACSSYMENSSLNFSSVNGPPNTLLEEGEVWSVKDLNLEDDIHDDQISLVSDDDNDIDSLESQRQLSSENITCQKASVVENALHQPVFNNDRYAFWINKVQLRTVTSSYSDFSSCDLNVNIVVFKLSNLCLSFDSPLLEEFIISFLPRYRQYLNTLNEQKNYFAEIFLIQSQLNPRSLNLLLMSFRRFNFAPTALHVGSNPDLGSEGMLVLSQFISESKEPLRWLVLSKCQTSLSSFKTILTAVLSRLDIYPRMHNRESVPLWLELPTILDENSTQQKDANSSFLLNTKVFEYLDSIRPGLYCPILNRTTCRINCCGTPGAIFHIPNLSNTLVQSSSKVLVDVVPKNIPHPTLSSSLQEVAEMSEIDSEDEKDNSLPLSQELSIHGNENVYQQQAPEQTNMTFVDNTLSLAYQSLLQECFFSISMAAAEYQILPFNFLQDMASIYIEGKDFREISLPLLWKHIPPTVLAEYLSSIPTNFPINSQIKETTRSKRPRQCNQDETEEEKEENTLKTGEAPKNKQDVLNTSYNSINIRESPSCAEIEKPGLCHDNGFMSDMNARKKGLAQSYQDDEMLHKKDQSSTSEEGEIPDVNVFSVAFPNHEKQLHSRYVKSNRDTRYPNHISA